jgi:hypothetical protein
MQQVLPEIITSPAKTRRSTIPFDCVGMRQVRSMCWVFGNVTMIEAFTALFGVISAGIFIAHAVDGYLCSL